MSNYGEIFSDAIPGTKEKKSDQPVKAKRAYTRREKSTEPAYVPIEKQKPTAMVKLKTDAPPTRWIF